MLTAWAHLPIHLADIIISVPVSRDKAGTVSEQKPRPQAKMNLAMECRRVEIMKAPKHRDCILPCSRTHKYLFLSIGKLDLSETSVKPPIRHQSREGGLGVF